MRRHIVTGVLGVSVGLIVTTTACGKEKPALPEAKKASAQPAAASPKGAAAPDDAAEQERAKREKALQEWRAKLTGSKWELQLTPTGVPSGAPETDALAFTQRTVGSDAMRAAGFTDSDNYALHSATEQSVAWEAMQVKEEKGAKYMAIWRAEVTDQTMQGMLFTRETRGEKETTEQFSFTGRRLAAATETAPEAAPPAVEPGAPPASPRTQPGSPTASVAPEPVKD